MRKDGARERSQRGNERGLVYRKWKTSKRQSMGWRKSIQDWEGHRVRDRWKTTLCLTGETRILDFTGKSRGI